MKAKTPFTLQRTAKQRREMAVWVNLLLCCWALHRNFGFGPVRLKRFLVCFGEATKELADIRVGNVRNKTWQDELWHWADGMGLNDAVEEEA